MYAALRATHYRAASGLTLIVVHGGPRQPRAAAPFVAWPGGRHYCFCYYVVVSIRTTTSDVGLLSYSVQAGSIVPLQLVRRLPHLMRAEPCQRHRRRARRAAGGAAVCSAVVLERTNGLCRTASVRPSLPPVGLSLCRVPLLQALRRARDVAEDAPARATRPARERRWRRAAARPSTARE